MYYVAVLRQPVITPPPLPPSPILCTHLVSVVVLGLSGQVFYDYLNSTMWALVYTGLPIVLFGVYDMDVLPRTALRYPWLYRTGVDDELLTKHFFWGWIAQVRDCCWGSGTKNYGGLGDISGWIGSNCAKAAARWCRADIPTCVRVCVCAFVSCVYVRGGFRFFAAWEGMMPWVLNFTNNTKNTKHTVNLVSFFSRGPFIPQLERDVRRSW